MSSIPDPPAPPAGATPTLTDRFMKKLTAAREIVDPPTPVRLLITGGTFAAVTYMTVHFIRSLYEADTVNSAISPLYWVGIVVIAVLDLGWMSKKNRAKLERRRAASARWRETIAEHNARVLALNPPPTEPSDPKE